MLMLRERSGKTRSLSDGQCDNLPLEYAILRRSDSKCAVGLEECEYSRDLKEMWVDWLHAHRGQSG